MLLFIQIYLGFLAVVYIHTTFTTSDTDTARGGALLAVCSLLAFIFTFWL